MRYLFLHLQNSKERQGQPLRRTQDVIATMLGQRSQKMVRRRIWQDGHLCLNGKGTRGLEKLSRLLPARRKLCRPESTAERGYILSSALHNSGSVEAGLPQRIVTGLLTLQDRLPPRLESDRLRYIGINILGWIAFPPLK